MELDESGFPQPTGRFETLAADTVDPRARSGDRHRVPARACRASRSSPTEPSSVSNLETGCPGVFAGGDMVPSERTVTVGVGHGKKAARADRRLAARRRGRGPGEASAGDLRQAAPLVLRRRGAPRSSPSLTPPSGSPASRRSSAGSPTRKRCSRRAAACRAATASSATAAWAPAPRTPSSSSARAPLPVRLRPLHRLPGVLRAVPGPRDRDGRRSAADARDARRQRGGGLGRLPAERDVLHLPDHAVVADGGARRRVVEPGRAERLGDRARRSSRCRARAAPPGPCTARSRAARSRRRSPRRRACC